MLFSIIIPTINRKQELKECLSSILSKGFENVEIIIIDQNPSEFELIKYIGEDINKIIYLEQKNNNASLARNIAAQRANGKFLVFVDDDACLSVNFFDVLKREIKEHEDCAAFVGDVIDFMTKRRFSKHNIDSKLDLNFFNFLSHSSESALVIEKEFFLAIGGFDVDFGPGAKFPSSEGPDLIVRLLLQNKKVLFLPSLLVYHPIKVNNYNQKEYFRAFNYCFSIGAFYKKHLFCGHRVELLACFIWHIYIYLRNIFFYLVLNRRKMLFFCYSLKGFVKGLFAYRDNKLKVINK